MILGKKQINYSLRLPDALHKLLLREAKRRGCKPSELARLQIGKLDAQPVQDGGQRVQGAGR